MTTINNNMNIINVIIIFYVYCNKKKKKTRIWVVSYTFYMFPSFPAVLFAASPPCLSTWTWPLNPTRCRPCGSSGMWNSVEGQWGSSPPLMGGRYVSRARRSGQQTSKLHPNNWVNLYIWLFTSSWISCVWDPNRNLIVMHHDQHIST